MSQNLRKITVEQRAEMQRLFQAGVPAKQLAKQFGISTSTVNVYCGGATPKARSYEVYAEQIEALWKQGQNKRQISLALKISPVTVDVWLSRSGLL